MRKFFTLLAVGAMAMSAHAIDYYLIGGFNNWTTKDAASKFTDKGDGTFELDYNGTLTSGFKINDGTWDNPAANFGGNGSNLVLGETYTLTVSGSSPNIAMTDNVENPHLVFNPTAKTLVVTGQGQAVEYTYALHGQIFGEPVKWSSVDMTAKNGKWVLENTTVDAGSFGIRKNDKSTGSQVDWISSDGAAAVVLNSAMKCKVEGTNWAIEAGTYSFTFDPEAMTLTVTGEGTGPVLVETLYLIGEPAGGWAANVGEKLEGSEGIFTYSADFAKQTYFGFATELGANANDWDTLNANRYGSNQTVGEADSYDIVEAGTYTMQKPNGNSWNLPAGKWTLTVNTVENTLVVTGQGDLPPVPEVPETLYIIGNIDDNDWNPVNPIPMTKSGNTFTVEAEAVANVEGKSFFSFCSAKGSTNDNAGWGELSGSDRYGAATEGAVATVGTPFAYTVYKANVNASACKSWSIAPNTDGHKYKFTVDFDKQTVSVTMTSGVDSIEVENDGEAVYFNLQGVRVDNPENGIFVRVANGKAVKVVK